MNQKLNLRMAIAVLAIVGILSLGGVYIVKQKLFVPGDDVQPIPKVTDNSQKQGTELLNSQNETESLVKIKGSRLAKQC